MKKIIYLLALLICSSAFGQSLSVFDINTDDFPIVKAKFWAFDENGLLIRNFATDDFEITENGEQREATYVSCPPEKDPVAISSVLVMDASGSMGGPNIEMAKEAAKSWILGLPLDISECAITAFDDKNYYVQDFTMDRERLLQKAQTLFAGGGTDYNVAMMAPMAGGLQVTKNAKYKKVIVFLSDGQPNYEPNTGQIIAEAHNQDVTIFAVTLNHSCPQCLKDMTEQTGGHWFENVTSVDEAKSIYKSILMEAQENIEPCEIEWESDKICKPQYIEAKAKLKNYDLNYHFKYQISYKQISNLIFDPQTIFFENPDIGIEVSQKVTVTAERSIFNVSNIIASDPDFNISPKNFRLNPGESIELTVSYTPQDSNVRICYFSFENDICEKVFIAVGGWKSKHLVRSTLKLTHPNGGEKFLAGSDTIITWEGVSEQETVKLDYSIDNGNSWKRITDNANNLIYTWKDIPLPTSSNCLVRINQGFEKESANEIKTLWDKTYGGKDRDYAESIVECIDGSLVVVGSTRSEDGDVSRNQGASDFWVIKINQIDGSIIWEKTYGSTGLEIAKSVIESTDGSLVVVGYTTGVGGDVSENKGQYDIWIIKLNPDDGSLIWEKSYGGRGDQYANSVIEGTDGSLVVAGFASTNDGDVSEFKGGNDIWILKLNPYDGSLIWDKCFGGFSMDHAYSILQSTDGSLVVAGFASSATNDVSENKGGYDFWIIKLNSDDGSLIWERAYGGSLDDIAMSVTESIDGSLYIAGSTESYNGDISNNNGQHDFWILKLNPYDGSLIWEKSLGGSLYEEAYCIIESFDGYVIAVGVSYSKDGDVSNYINEGDFWIVKLDPDDGTLIWEKSLGGSDGETALSVTKCYDGTFVLAGTTNSRDGYVDDFKGHWDFWVVKLDPGYGMLQSDISDSTFSIVMPECSSRNIDMKQALLGTSKDSIVVDFIENAGEWEIRIDSVYIQGADESAFRAISGKPERNLKIGESWACEFLFTPSRVGQHQAEIVIITQAGTLYQTIIGEGVTPQLLILEDIIDFGYVDVGDTKDTIQVLTIKNAGTSQLNILDTKHNKPNDYDFSTISGGGAFSLDPGDTCKMNLRFSPSYVGRTTGTLEFHYNGTGSPAVIQLYGQGIGYPQIAVDEIPYRTLLCQSSDTIDVVIKNPGTDVLTIVNAQIIGDDKEDYDFLEEFTILNVVQGKSDTLKLLFSPKSIGEKHSQLLLNNNTHNNPAFTIDLTAYKDSSDFYISDTELSFETYLENQKMLKNIEIFNTGKRDLNWDVPLSLNYFTIEKVDPNPTLAGESSVVEIHFHGATDGSYQESFNFIDEYCGRIKTLNLEANVDSDANPNATIEISDISAYPGDEIEVPIILKSKKYLDVAGVSSLKAELVFNSSLLYPFDIPMSENTNSIGKITLNNLPVNLEKGDVLESVRFLVGLGNADGCDLILSNAEPVDGNADISTINGHFTLLGICEDGGDRLINPNSNAGIISIKPNPVESEIEVEFNLSERGKTEIALHNMIGVKALQLYSSDVSTVGNKSITQSIEGLSSGIYFLIFRTKTKRETYTVMIVR